MLDGRALRKKTRQVYKTKIDAFINYCELKNTTEVREITNKFCKQFLAYCRFKSNTTHNSYKENLCSFFAEAKEIGMIENNPFEHIRSLPEHKRGQMFFRKEQVQQLCLHLEEREQLFMACKLLYYCFIRNEEIANLPIQDINISERIIVVHSSYAKNKKTQTVVIPEEFLPEVKVWYKRQKLAGAEYFITKPNGQKVPRGDWFNKEHAKIIKELGYGKRYSFYSWKHTGAVEFYKATKDIKALQLQMRHHSLDQTDEYLREFGVMEQTTIRDHKLPKMPLKVAA